MSRKRSKVRRPAVELNPLEDFVADAVALFWQRWGGYYLYIAIADFGGMCRTEEAVTLALLNLSDDVLTTLEQNIRGVMYDG